MPGHSERQLSRSPIFILCLIMAGFVSTAANAEVVRYRLDVLNTWSTTTHPGAFPTAAHFSFLGGATHDGGVTFWEPGGLATAGIQRMAETGAIDQLEPEVLAAIGGTAGSFLGWEHWFCPAETSHANCGPTSVSFDIDSTTPLVTLVTMLGPSPDWFVGVNGLSLRDSTDWLPFLMVDLVPYDGGTLDGLTFVPRGNPENPHQPISLITDPNQQLVGPGSLGSFSFTLIPTPVPPALPLLLSALLALGWYARRRRSV